MKIVSGNTRSSLNCENQAEPIKNRPEPEKTEMKKPDEPNQVQLNQVRLKQNHTAIDAGLKARRG